jgi:hypothetical protein
MLFIVYSADQSIGSLLIDFKYLLVLLKCLQPKNPLCAENGEGWGAVRT